MPPLSKPNPDDELIPEEPKGPSVTINKRRKPDIEGITVPAGQQKPPLTPAEKKLIEDLGKPQTKPVVPLVRPVSERITLPPRKSRVLKTLFYLVFLAVVVTAGYVAYTKFAKAPTSPAPAEESIVVPTPESTPSATSSVGSLAASSSTSSIVSTLTPTSTPATATTTPSVEISSTPTGYLNVRNGPGSSFTQITQVHPGDVYPYTNTKNGWYEITLTNGSSGWVSGQYVTKQ